MASMKVRARAIRALEDRLGRVTASSLVEAARSPRHPLHNDFEWDDTEAAHQYRLQQARQIISSVRVTFQAGEQQVRSVAYVRDVEAVADKTEGYRRIDRVRTDRDAAYDTMISEIDRAQTAIERAREIAAALELAAEFDAAVASMLELRSRVRRGPSPHDDSDQPRPPM